MFNIESSWKRALAHEFDKEYFKKIVTFVEDEYKSQTIFPPRENIFRAFSLCTFDAVRVVILGQDPYHGPNQANGLSFAVQKGIRLPPSLKNIFKEVVSDMKIDPEQSGDLTRWAEQGVLLLNATLTVQEQNPGSHQHKGWEEFTDAVIKTISDTKEHVVFVLWGKYAKQKGAYIDRTKHCVIESAHPSPFSAHTGFFGSKPFSTANAYLKQHGLKTIDWK